VLLEVPNVEDAVVSGEPHPLTGQIVVAHLRLVAHEPVPDLKARIRSHCQGRLAPFKIPARIVVSTEPLYGARFKRQRRGLAL
jgi:long-chain acyl-CoA synthetase